MSRPIHAGAFGARFTVPPFDRDREAVEVMQRPLEVDPPELVLAAETEEALRIGLGRTDMEVRWMASLDESDTLRLWRSWTGHEIYRATFERRTDGLKLAGLLVESAPDVHRVDLTAPAGERFVETLRHCLSLILPS